MTTTIIKDNDKVREILQALEDAGKLRFCEVQKVKLRNRIHRQQQIVNNLFFAAFVELSINPLLVCYIKERSSDGEITYISHLDISHYNISSIDIQDPIRIDGKEYILYVRTFCNPVKQKLIWNDAKRASIILMGNLMDAQPNDSYRTPDSVDIDNQFPALYDFHGSFIKNTASLKDMSFRNYRTTDDTVGQAEYLSVVKALQRGEVYAYCRKWSPGSITVRPEYKLVTPEELNKPEMIVSNYYKTYTKEDIDVDSDGQQSRFFNDVLCIGCGSGGSMALSQIKRTNYFNSYVLVDFDCIQTKNLRNQDYCINDIGANKVTALSSDIIQVNRYAKVAVYKTKFQNVPLEAMEFLYTILATDSIDSRLEYLKGIQDGRYKTKYLIDVRYDGLSSSLYFINTSDERQLEYYKGLLEADGEAFTVEYYTTDEEILKYLKDRDVFINRCSAFQRELGIHVNCEENCADCNEAWITAIRDNNIQIPKEDKEQDEGCVAQNIVHIYTLTSSWIVAAIRSIMSEQGKPFTHVEITAEPIPNAVIVRK